MPIAQANRIELIDGEDTDATLRASRLARQPRAAFALCEQECSIDDLNQRCVRNGASVARGHSQVSPSLSVAAETKAQREHRCACPAHLCSNFSLLRWRGKRSLGGFGASLFLTLRPATLHRLGNSFSAFRS